MIAFPIIKSHPLTTIHSRTNARIEDRLNKMDYIMRHVAKSQQKMSRKHKAQITAPGTTSTTIQTQLLPGTAVTSPIHLDNLATPSISQIPEAEVQAIHPYVMMSAIQEDRRNSTATQYTVNTVTDSVITGVTDLSINDLDVEDLLRPVSEPLQVTTALDLTAVTTLSTGLDPDSSSRLREASTRSQTSVVKRKQKTSITLSHILDQKTRSPYSLFDLYIYMRYRGAEDNLDF